MRRPSKSSWFFEDSVCHLSFSAELPVATLPSALLDERFYLKKSRPYIGRHSGFYFMKELMNLTHPPYRYVLNR
jgi:hypothetical protein